MKFIPNAVSIKAARAVLVAQKHSPETLFVSGLIGMGATVVLACKATLKVEEVLDKAESDLDKVRITRDTPPERLVGEYTHADAKRDTVIIYTRTGVELLKLYAPAILCGVVSVAALTGAHRILNQRNAALAAAYGTLQKSFEGYRSRVREEYGEERERELYHDALPCEIDDEAKPGKTKKVMRANGGSPYSKFFDEFNQNYETTPEYNFTFLKLQQRWANQRLQTKGHLLLNDVLEVLGFERTPEGCVVGWLKDGNGDGFVDFGIFTDDPKQQERLLDFMSGREKGVWLDFNVDGTIYDKI